MTHSNIVRYFLRILIAFDRMLNTVIGGNDKETLSSVAFRKHRDKQRFGFLMSFINSLFGNPLHCVNAYMDDRAHTLPA